MMIRYYELRVTRADVDAILEGLHVSLARTKANSPDIDTDPVLLADLIDAIETEMDA